MSFGQRLRRERLRRYLSQEALAEAVETSSKSINRWEQDQALPQGAARLRLCRFFQLSPEELFGESEEKPPCVQVWSVPYARNPFFTGREEILKTLHRLLNEGHALAVTQSLAVNGLGGIGKSQIVLEYAYQYREEYRFIFWTSAGTREALQTDLVGIADLLQLAEGERQDQEKVLQAVREWFATHSDWLWILDNAEDVAMMNDILPQERPGHVLLTSRAQAWGHLAQSLEVQPMGKVEATLFLLRRGKRLGREEMLDQIGESHRDTAEAIVQEMDCLPLALDQAGAYIDEVGCSLGAYVKLYREHRKELLQRRGHLAGDHPEPVATTWDLSFQKVEGVNEVAAELLRLCVFLEPDMIPEELLSAGMASEDAHSPGEGMDGLVFDEAIEELRKFSLIHRDPETRMYRLHRLVQAVLKDTMEREVQRYWAESVVRATARLFPEKIDISTQSSCQRYLAQAQRCRVLIQEYEFVFEEAIELLVRVAGYFQVYALYQQAEPLYQHVLSLEEQRGVSEGRVVARALNGLAMIFFKQGKYEESEVHFRRVLGSPGEGSEVERARALNGLANLYLEGNRYKEAEVIFGEALEIVESGRLSEQGERAVTLAGLGTLCVRQGKYEEAEPLLERALWVRERQMGKDHADVGRSLHTLAHLYWQQGRYEEAERLLERALEIKEQHFGEDHPDVARSAHNLGALYWQQGKLKQAERFFQRAIRISELRLGAEHADTAISLHGLALLYDVQEKYREAEQLYRRAFLIFERQLGVDHSETGRNVHNLGRLYFREGRYAEAEPLLEKALRVRERCVGKDHPDMAESLHSVGKLYLRQGRYEEAEVLLKQGLEIRERQLDMSHPDIAESLHGLAELSQYQGKYEEVESFYERALRILETHVIAWHPDTAQVLYDFALFREAQGRNEEAIMLYRRSWEIREQVLGVEHPATVVTRTAYTVLLGASADGATATFPGLPRT